MAAQEVQWRSVVIGRWKDKSRIQGVPLTWVWFVSTLLRGFGGCRGLSSHSANVHVRLSCSHIGGGSRSLRSKAGYRQFMPGWSKLVTYVGNFLSASRCLAMHRDGQMPGRPHGCIETSHKRIPMQTGCDGSGIGMPSR